MNYKTSAVLFALAQVAWLNPLFSAPGPQLYRYTNDRGNVVIDYRVPNKYAGAGYEVLNEQGVVVAVVPREPTAEEKANKSVQQKLEREAKAEQERLREWDESLLLRYSTIADIEAARERSLRDLRIRVSILKSNKRSLKGQVETYQAQAADMERRGQEVDLARLKVIESLQKDIETANRAIADREREVAEVAASYEADIERFGLLLEVVELRRSMLATDRK